MAVNQSHTENRRGVVIPFGERCLKGIRGAGRGALRAGRRPTGGAGGLQTLSQSGPFPLFRVQQAEPRPRPWSARALAGV